MAREKGWFPAAKPHQRPQVETHVVYPTPEDGLFRFLPGIPIFTDGSCYNGTDSALAVAGVALFSSKQGLLFDPCKCAYLAGYRQLRRQASTWLRP